MTGCNYVVGYYKRCGSVIVLLLSPLLSFWNLSMKRHIRWIRSIRWRWANEWLDKG